MLFSGPTGHVETDLGDDLEGRVRVDAIDPGEVDNSWTNDFVERLQGTILTELWRCAFRRTYYLSVAAMQRDLDRYLQFYNFERSHQGYRLHGRTPAEVFYAHA